MSCNDCNESQSNDGFLARRSSYTTKAIHAAQDPERWNSHCVVTPIYTSVTFKQKAPGEPYHELNHVQEVLANNGYHVNRRTKQPTKTRKHPEVKRQPAYMPYVRGVTDKIGGVLKKYSIPTIYTPGAKEFEYGRSGNPTRNTLEACIAALDGGKHGLTFSSGIGATSSIFALLGRGDHIICCDGVYVGTNRLFSNIGSRMGIDTTFVECTVLENVEKGIKSNTKMIWLETPTNPKMKVIDIAGVAKIAKHHEDIIVVVDNTFLTSYLQRPLDFGADIVMYSLTKYMNGHADVIMGAAVVNDDAIAERLRFIQLTMGAIPSPIDCYLVLRGLKTLEIRLEQHKRNALIVANWLHDHPNVKKVYHPALPDHPGYDITKRQTAGHSSCFSFEHKGGLEESKKFFSALNIFSLAISLGGYESMVQLPRLMTHVSLSPEARQKLDVTDAFVRIAVGLEHPGALIEDLDQAFKAAFGTCEKCK